MHDLLISALVGSGTGVVMALFGAGGGIITVPVFVYLLNFDPRVATLAALVTGSVTAASAMIGHGRAGRVRWRDGIVFAVVGFAGSAVGTPLSWLADPDAFMLAFGILIIIASIIMVFNRRVAGHLAARRPDDFGQGRVPINATFIISALVCGVLTGFFGIGAGFVVVPIFVLALGMRIHEAAATSAVVITVANIFALIVRLPLAANSGDLSSIQWDVIGVFTAFAVVSSLLSVRLAARLPERTLNIGFTIMLAVLGVVVMLESILT